MEENYIFLLAIILVLFIIAFNDYISIKTGEFHNIKVEINNINNEQVINQIENTYKDNNVKATIIKIKRGIL